MLQKVLINQTKLLSDLYLAKFLDTLQQDRSFHVSQSDMEYGYEKRSSLFSFCFSSHYNKNKIFLFC